MSFPGWRICIFSFILVYNISYSQENLIQNGSFEILNSCPYGNTNTSSIEFAVGWRCPVDTSIYPFYASPDLFNRCSSGYFGVPSNWYGYQESIDGDGYAGIGIYHSVNNLREFIQYKIDHKLILGKKYLLTFDFSFGYAGSYKCNNISFALTEKSIEVPNLTAIQSGKYFPELTENDTIEFNELFKADTLSWTRFSREFVAQSAAQYLTVGNMRNNNETQTKFGWYYDRVVIHSISLALLDNISLICLDTANCDSATATTPVNEKEIRVYPNPASDFFTVETPDSLSGIMLELFDVNGRLVIRENILQPVQRIFTRELSSGLYYYRVISTEKLAGKGLLMLDKSR